MKQQRDSIIYQRSGDSIEVKHIVGGNVQDVRFFKLNHEKDNERFFEYVCEKLGFNITKYKRKKRKFEWS